MHANLEYKYQNSAFWYRGFYVSTVGNNKSAVYNWGIFILKYNQNKKINITCVLCKFVI